MTSNRHQRREAKAARRRKRLATGRKRFTAEQLLEIKGKGVERLEQAFANAPKEFGKAKAKPKGPKLERVPCECRGVNHGTHVRRVVEPTEKGRVAA